MNIEQNMYKRAVEFIEQRFPTGWGGVGVIHTEDDKYLISVALETANAGVMLCIETGAMCEAQKYNLKVTHCLCVVRDDEGAQFKVLSPCGVCQERLRYWGKDVKVGVTTKDDVLKFVTLNELQPYHWTGAYPKEELEHYQKVASENNK
ncbi:cytidine deaminase [Clostridium sp.]|uniref:cytidine deaminase n=1 Tax=Clostridium sp. TaxID=1506 RepID=UPI001A4F619C|nr:cytidine deaminase [Clostridium sp.]MBK5235317.1 cytidine deaminase [Clostridium sp.]